VNGTLENGSADRADRHRIRKFRQAAFVYLHVALLYEFTVFIVWRRGLLPEGRGSGPVWLLIGALITGLIFWGLWSRRSSWLARIVWALHALRLPAILQGAFFAAPEAGLPPALWRFALVVVLLNLCMLARAGWDL
jgi:hypothetical protein